MRTHKNGVQIAQNQGDRLISVLFWFLYSRAVKTEPCHRDMVESRGTSVSRVTWIHTLSLNQGRNQSNGHCQPSHTETPLFWHSPAFGHVSEVLSWLGLDWLLELASFFPSGHCCGVWALGEPGAGFQPTDGKAKGKEKKERRKWSM